MKKTEPENNKEYLCGHEESAWLVMKILCKACGLFMKFSFFHTRSQLIPDHVVIISDDQLGPEVAMYSKYPGRLAGMTMTSKANLLGLMSRPQKQSQP